MKDLFEFYEEMPSKLKALMAKWESKCEEGMTYKDCEKMLTQCEKIGFTFEYGLDAIPYGLRPIGTEWIED